MKKIFISVILGVFVFLIFIFIYSTNTPQKEKDFRRFDEEAFYHAIRPYSRVIVGANKYEARLNGGSFEPWHPIDINILAIIPENNYENKDITINVSLINEEGKKVRNYDISSLGVNTSEGWNCSFDNALNNGGRGNIDLPIGNFFLKISLKVNGEIVNFEPMEIHVKRFRE